MYNFGAKNPNVKAAEVEMTEESEDTDGNIVLKKRKTINRQIEEGLFNLKDEDFNRDGTIKQLNAWLRENGFSEVKETETPAA